MSTPDETDRAAVVLTFAQLREEVGLPPLAAGLPSQPLWVPPMNALSDNPGEISFMEPEIPDTLSLSEGKGRKASDLLKSFSWWDEAAHLLTPVVDQEACGCCWAIAVTGCLNDRLAVRYGRNPLLLFQQLMACTPACELCHTCGVESGFESAADDGITPFLSLDLGANETSPEEIIETEAASTAGGKQSTATGANTPSASGDLQQSLDAKKSRFAKMMSLGIPNGQGVSGSQTATTGGGLLSSPRTKLGFTSTTTATEKTPAPSHERAADTKHLCLSVSEALFQTAKKRLLVQGKLKRSPSLLALQNAILHRGPVVTIMRVFADFIVGSDPGLGNPFESTDGVYIHRHGSTNYGVPPHKNRDLGTHCMVIVGWGRIASGILYWVVRNSWGVRWGNNGYCRIAATDPNLGNTLVGIDLSVKTVLNNVTSLRYGNAWIVPHASWSTKVYGGPALTRTSAGKLSGGEPSQTRRALILAVLTVGLLLVCLCCMWRQ